MTLKTLLVAAGAASLIAGAAYAQVAGSDVTPGNSDTNNLPSTSTGLPASPVMHTPVVGSVNSSADGATVSTETSASTSGAYSATTVGTPASGYATTGATVTTRLVTNGPVPDTAENRAKYGQPLSRAGKRTAPAGN